MYNVSVPCSYLLQMRMCAPEGTYHLHPSPVQGKAKSVRNNQHFKLNVTNIKQLETLRESLGE